MIRIIKNYKKTGLAASSMQKRRDCTMGVALLWASCYVKAALSNLQFLDEKTSISFLFRNKQVIFAKDSVAE